jgi:hypothetical protein
MKENKKPGGDDNIDEEGDGVGHNGAAPMKANKQ